MEETPLPTNGSEPVHQPDAVVKFLSRDDILLADDIAYETVDVPEWGGPVRVKSLSGTERDEFEASVTQMHTVRGRQEQTVVLRNVRAKLAVRCIVDADGERMFHDSDIGMLGKKSAGALDRVVEACQRLSGLTDEDVQDLAANLEAGQNVPSGSD